jgi:hypothetical protein
MRKGAQLRPQCRDVFFSEVRGVICSCGLGASLEGAGILNGEELPCPDLEMFNGFDGVGLMVQCPVKEKCYAAELTAQIIHLNDDHLWTREAIADWLKTLGY